MRQTEAPDDNPLATLQGELKSNRRILLGLIILATVTASILASSSAFLLFRLWNPIEVPSTKFDKELSDISDSFNGLLLKQSSQIATYAALQTNLDQVKSSYTSKNIADLRLTLIEREQDNRKLLSLMNSGMADLALMVRGSKQASDAFKKDISILIKESERRENDLIKASKSL